MRLSSEVSKADLHRSAKRNKREVRSQVSTLNPIHCHRLPIQQVYRRLVVKRVTVRKKNSPTIKIPRNFSIYEKPEDVLNTIFNLCEKISSTKKNVIYCDYSLCDSFSLGSEALLGIIAGTIKYQRSLSGESVYINGAYPKNPSHLEIVRDLGIVKEIDADNDHRESADTSLQFIFSKQKTEQAKGSAHAQDDKNRVAQQFVEYIDNCLDNGLSKSLTQEACRVLKSCIGEMLDNSERHGQSNGQGKWYIRAHVNFSHSHPICEIAIFNFGNTVSETFNKLPPDHFSLTKQIEPYVRRHIGEKGLTEDNLKVVASLQGRVSCKNLDDRNTCGTGTIELLTFFQGLSDSIAELSNSGTTNIPPVMSLLSGSTWINFDGRYKLKKSSMVVDEQDDPTSTYDTEKMIYPFNNSPDGLASPPDATVVKSMSGTFFPGLMLNIKFALEIQ
jgi:hypothetical protein